MNSTAQPDPLSDCPVCDARNASDAKLCADCGAPVNLADCPQCEAINARNATQCWKCAALLQPSAGTSARVAVRSDDAHDRTPVDGAPRSAGAAAVPAPRVSAADHGTSAAETGSVAAAPEARGDAAAAQTASTTPGATPVTLAEPAALVSGPELPVCRKCGAVNAVHALYCRTCNAALHDRAGANEGAAFDEHRADVQEEIDAPRHYIGNDFDALAEAEAPAPAARARWRAGWTILGALALLVLPAVIAVGVYAHFRPTIVSHVVDAAKMRLNLASWAYVEGDAAASDASTSPPGSAESTGVGTRPAIPPAPTGIPGLAPTPPELPPLERPAPARIPDAASTAVAPASAPAGEARPAQGPAPVTERTSPARAPGIEARTPPAPAAPAPLASRPDAMARTADRPPERAMDRPIAGGEASPNRRDTARIARGDIDARDGYRTSPGERPLWTPSPEFASESERDDARADRTRRRAGSDVMSSGSTSDCTPEIVDQGRCRPEVR